MAITRILLAGLAIALCAIPHPLYSQAGRTLPPLGIVRLVGPDGPVGEALERALLHGWRARGGQGTYAGYASQALVMRGLAAMREQAPPDLAILDPAAAEAAFGRGLVMMPPAESVPGAALLLPIAREAGRVCVPVAFDALAVVFPAAQAADVPPGLGVLDRATPAERASLPAPAQTLGAYLVSLLAYAEVGDWRLSDAGLRRLAALRGAEPAPEAAPGPAIRAVAAAAAANAGFRTGVAWNSAAQIEADASPGQGAAIPREGVMLRPLLLCLSASATHLRSALALIDHALRPDTQAALASALYVAPAREAVALPDRLRRRIPDVAIEDTRLLLPDARFIARLRATGEAPPPRRD